MLALIWAIKILIIDDVCEYPSISLYRHITQIAKSKRTKKLVFF